MMTPADYLRHAQQCRELAGLMEIPERRQQLLDMALVWDRMAQEGAEPGKPGPKAETKA